jgi:threonine dehydrogenase-like Zn-dependent dehydrogenase
MCHALSVTKYEEGTMKALVYMGEQNMVIKDEPTPEASAGEVIIEMRAAAICGSELGAVKHNDPSRKVPLIMGHEFVGIRADTGQLVAINPLVTCGVCDRCRGGQENLCRTRSLIGVHRSGGFAEQVAVPIGNTHALPDGTSILAAVLIEPLANAWHLWHLSGATASSRVGIIGGGAIGLMTAIVAAHSGATDVTLADVSEARRGTALDAGVTTVVDHLEGEYDVIVDAVGAHETRASSVRLLCPGGRALWEGLHDGESSVDGRDLARREISVLGSFAYLKNEFELAVQTVGLVDERWVEAVPLDEGDSVFLRLMGSSDAAVRTALVSSS